MNVIKSEGKPVITRAFLALQQKAKQNEFSVLSICEKPKVTEENANLEKRKRAKGAANGAINDEDEFDMKKARHEVVKFAMGNQKNSKDKDELQILQAIRLGAKPQPKPYKNYKELQADRKKAIEEDQGKFLGKSQTSLLSIKRKQSRSQGAKRRVPIAGIDKPYGSVKSVTKNKKYK